MKGIRTTKGPIRAKKIGLAVAGNTSRLAQMAGIDVPIESHVLQAFVSEGVKPLVDQVITFGAGHFYISQSDKGGLVFGGGGTERKFRAYDARTGKQLWETVMPSGVTGTPSSYTVNGKQYIAVGAGGNSQLDFKRGNSVFVFAL